jgi:single-strand DNA-binding protein
MSSINKAILIGNLGNDPELRETKSGESVVNFRMATSWRSKDKAEVTSWHNIVVFGKQGKTVAEFMKKGSKVYVEGRIQERTWDDKDGNKRYMTEIIANDVRFMDKKASESAEGVDFDF